MTSFGKMIFFKLIYCFLVTSLFAKDLTVKEYLLQVYKANFDIKKTAFDVELAALKYEIGNLSLYTPQILYNLELTRSKKDNLGLASLKDDQFGVGYVLQIDQPIGIWGTKIGVSYDQSYRMPSSFFPNSVNDYVASNKFFSKIGFSIKQPLGRGGPFLRENKNKINLLKINKQLIEAQRKGVIQNTLIQSWSLVSKYIIKKNEEKMVTDELIAAQKIYQFRKDQFAKKSIRKTELYVAESFFIQKEMKKNRILDELQALLNSLQKFANSQEEFSFLDSGESMQLDFDKLRSNFDILERPNIFVQTCLQDMEILQNKIAFSESLPKIDLVAKINFHSGVGRETLVNSIYSVFGESPEFAFSISIASPLIPKIMRKDLLERRIKLQKEKESLHELQNHSLKDIVTSKKRWELSKIFIKDSERVWENSKNILLENRKNLQNGKIDLDAYLRFEAQYEQSSELRSECKLQERMLFLTFLVNQGIQISTLVYGQ